MNGVLIVRGSFSIFYHLFKHRTPVDRVKWFRDRADQDCFREEAQILDAEFKRTIISFSRMSEVWTELAIKAASPGSAAYAHRKATMYRGLEEECAQAYTAVLKRAGSGSSA
jgi:hypothetical protein